MIYLKLFADDTSLFATVHTNKTTNDFNNDLTKISTIGIIRQLQNILLRSALLTFYKSFIRPHLHYGDIIYYKSFNESFHANWNHFNITLHWP